MRIALMSHVPYPGCNVARLDEEIVKRVWMQLAGPFEVDHRVDNDVGNMDALWSSPRAIDSARTRWTALVGAKPAKLALPRNADVLPEAMITL